MSTTPRRVFLSRVSREFGPDAAMLRDALQAVHIEARTQESFRQEDDTTTTLSKLSEYIREHTDLLAIVGTLSGGYPSDPSLDDPIHPAPPSGTAQKTWRDLLPDGFTRLSYTQWEVILARFWKKRVRYYFRAAGNPTPFTQTSDDDLPHQQEFISWLTKVRSLDRDAFSSPDQLKSLVLRDLWPRRLRTALWAVFAIAAAAVLVALLIPRPDVAQVDGKADAIMGKVDGLTQSIADLLQKNDDLKLRLADGSRPYNELSLAEREKLLAASAGISVEELRQRILDGTKSADEITRARARILNGDFDAALSITAPLKESRSADLIALCEIDAQAYEGKFQYAKALAERRKVVVLFDKEKAPVAWADAQYAVAWSLANLGEGRAAEPILREVVALQARVLGPEHPDTLSSRNSLANSLQAQGKNAEAETEHRALLAVWERVLGPEHPDTLGSRNNLANALRGQEKNAEAETEHRAVLAVRERVLGPEHPDTLGSRNNLANALQAQGKHAEAEAEHRAVLAGMERVLGPEHPATLTSRGNLATALGEQGKNAEEEAELRAVLAVRERVLGPEHPHTLLSHFNLAISLAHQKKWPEALTEAEHARAGRLKVLGAGHPSTKNAERLVAIIREEKQAAEGGGGE